MRLIILGTVTIGLVVASAANGFVPARYRSGAIPAVPAMVVGGGQVLLEVAVDFDGRVDAVVPLRTTPPFTAAVTGAVRTWHFSPATETEPVASKVLVAAVFRRPALNGPTLGQQPVEVGAASDAIPFPMTIREPAYPPMASGSAVVLVEAHVDRDGRIADAVTIRSQPPFDDAVRQALRGWTFRPARLRGTPVDAFAYIVFGFAVPVISE
ncbi:MAG TPA: TonB family protein [Vicinamibacterales bacterium]|nr:TonB family protein [Vicinamibacterales bacterium]